MYGSRVPCKNSHLNQAKTAIILEIWGIQEEEEHTEELEGKQMKNCICIPPLSI